MSDLFDNRPTLILARERCACGEASYDVLPGKGAHAAGLRCACCGKFHRWMSKIEFDHYQEINRG